MKGISLHQPWAAGIETGHKRWETRTRSAPRTVRGQRVFLHAAGTTAGIREADRTPGGHQRLRTVGYYSRPLPFGAIFATARIGRVLPIVASYERAHVEQACIAPGDDGTLTLYGDLAAGDDTTASLEDQRQWGDWSPGRWAWELLDVHVLPSWIITPGRQGWWEYPLDDLLQTA